MKRKSESFGSRSSTTRANLRNAGWPVAIAAGIGVIVAGQSAQAANTTFTTTSTSGNWSTATWSTAISGIGAGDIAQFNTNATSSLALNTDVTLGQLQTGTTSGAIWSLTGTTNTFSLDGTGITSGNQVFGNAGVAAIASRNNSALTVAPNISFGTTALDIGATSTGAVTINGNISASSGQTLNFRGSGSGAITVNGSIGNTGNSSIAVNVNRGSGGGTTFAAANNYTGATTVSSALTLSGSGAAANSAFTVLGNTLTVSGGSGTITRGASLTLGGGTAGIAASFTDTGVAATTNDTFTGALNIGTGRSNITLTPNASGQATVTFGSLGTRAAGSIALISGTFGGTPGVNNTTLKFTSTPSGSNFVGGGGVVTSSTASIFPWLRNTSSNHFLGYDATKGVTTISGEAANLTSGSTTNVYTNSGTALTMPNDETINSLVGDNASAAVTMNGHTLTVTSGAIMASIGMTVGNDASAANYGTLALGSVEGQFSARSNRTLTVNSAIAGSGGLTLTGDNGSSNIILGGANTYTGVTNMYVGGGVKITNSLAFQNTTVNYVNGNGPTLVFGNGGTTGQTAYTFGGLTGSQNINLNNNNTTVGAVALTIGSAGSADSASTVNTYSGVLSNTVAGGSIIKAGVATQVLSGVNTYTGATTITGGSLALGSAGSFANSPTINLNGGGLDVSAKSSFTFGSGQTLKGQGTLTGATTLNTVNGTLQLGQTHNSAAGSASTLTLTTATTLGSTANTEFDLFSPSSADKLVIGSTGTGTLNFGGTLTVASPNAFTFIKGQQWDLLDFGSASGNFTTLNLPTLDPSLSWDTSNINTTGVISVVPEPASLCAVAISAVGLLVRRRRKA